MCVCECVCERVSLETGGAGPWMESAMEVLRKVAVPNWSRLSDDLII